MNSVKLILLLLIFQLAFTLLARGQYYEYTFEPGYLDDINQWGYLELDDSGLWQIGKPQKADWDSAFSGNYVLMTDTLKILNKPQKASFVFKITRPWHMNCITGWNFSLAHMYDLPKGKAGAYIEVSYNEGDSWLQLVNDTLPCYDLCCDEVVCDIPHVESYLYADTIENKLVASGERVFWGGNANDIYTQAGKSFNLDTVSAKVFNVWLRFTYINTDTIAHKGWIIDNLAFNTSFWCEFLSVNEISKQSAIIYPNPVVGQSVVSFENPEAAEIQLTIYNLQGKVVMEQQSCNNYFVINKSDFSQGHFLYAISNRVGDTKRGQFVVDQY